MANLATGYEKKNSCHKPDLGSCLKIKKRTVIEARSNLYIGRLAL